MKNLLTFKTEEEYSTYKENINYPNVSLTEDNNKVWVGKDNVKLIKFGFVNNGFAGGSFLGGATEDPVNSLPLYTTEDDERLTLYAEEGITFGEWCNSKYAIFGEGDYAYMCNDNCISFRQSGGYDEGSSSINKDVVITNNALYAIHYLGCC